jgi:amino acid transporter
VRRVEDDARRNGEEGSRAQATDIGPASGIDALSDNEVAVLRQVGDQWGRAVAGRRSWLRALPVDPSLHRFPDSLQTGRVERFAAINFVEGEHAGEVEVAARAARGSSAGGRTGFRLRRVAFGPPLNSSAVAFERMRKLIALPILSSDALSSVAYGPEAMLGVLALAGSSALDLSLAISAVIVVLMVAVGVSYRQIVRAYPHGGGSYVVASENLGEFPALAAAAGLLIDYVLTVAVSISSGVAAITSAVPGLTSDAVPIGLVVIGVILVGNLRGVREAGAAFSAPTYAFVLAMFALIAVALAKAASHGFATPHPTGLHPVQAITVLLVLRAFSSGATAMTGIEAISNAVPAFQPPAWRNARTVLTVMVGLLVTMFAGLIVVIHLDGIVPRPGETVLSVLAHRSFGSGALYAYVQISTALVLLLAANTAFNGFPRLLSFMALNGHAPRVFLRLGDRLTFSNGMIVLAVSAAVLYGVFGGKTDALIPLYAVGVFVAFTFSQAAMVVHWWRRREANWRMSLVINAIGAALSAVVFLIAGVTKFTQGAWVALLLIVGLVLLTWRIHVHYVNVQHVLTLRAPVVSSPTTGSFPGVPTHRAPNPPSNPTHRRASAMRRLTNCATWRSSPSPISTSRACARSPMPHRWASQCWRSTSARTRKRASGSADTGKHGETIFPCRSYSPRIVRSSCRSSATSRHCHTSAPTSRCRSYSPS